MPFVEGDAHDTEPHAPDSAAVDTDTVRTKTVHAVIAFDRIEARRTDDHARYAGRFGEALTRIATAPVVKLRSPFNGEVWTVPPELGAAFVAALVEQHFVRVEDEPKKTRKEDRT